MPKIATLLISTALFGHLAMAQLPPPESLELGGVKFGDSRQVVLDAAKKLGLQLDKRSFYEGDKVIAVLAFVPADSTPRYANNLIVQFSPQSERVVGISRSKYYDQPLPRSTVYKSITDRFGTPMQILITGTPVENWGFHHWAFDSTGKALASKRCTGSLPAYKALDGCGLTIAVQHATGDPGYNLGMTIEMFDMVPYYQEVQAIAQAKKAIADEQMNAAKKLSVPRL